VRLSRALGARWSSCCSLFCYNLLGGVILAINKFKAGDKVVYPAHGVGEVISVEAKKVGGQDHFFYQIHIVEGGMKILVPTSQAESVGLRPVADSKTVKKVYDILKQKRVSTPTETWNRRFRAYTEKIKTGSLFEMAEVLRDLTVRGGGKELSYGEKKMLDTVTDLLVAELSVAKARPADRIRGELAELVPLT
jgi:CarD family transcriptional regulator